MAGRLFLFIGCLSLNFVSFGQFGSFVILDSANLSSFSRLTLGSGASICADTVIKNNIADPGGPIFLGTSMLDLSAGGTVCPLAFLPVTLVSFDGVWNDNSANLFWSTISDGHTKGFEIQRSPEGKSWEKAGWVEYQRSEAYLSHFEFTDHLEEIPEIVYYRLKQIDPDGSFEYSKIIRINTVEEGFEEMVSIYPNPASDKITVSFEALNADKFSFTLLDQNLRSVGVTSEKHFEEGTHESSINVSNLPSGLYYLQIISSSGRISRKVAVW